MSDSIERFVKKFERSAQEEAAHKTAVELLKNAISRNEAEMNLAAAAGDLELYRQIKAEKTGREEQLIVAEASFRVPVPDLDEAVAAWDSYSKKYKAEFAKKYEALQAARKAVKDALSDLAECQNQALKYREKLADICRVQYGTPGQDGSLGMFPVQRIEESYTPHPRFLLKLPDVSFLTELGFYGPASYKADMFSEVDRLHSIFSLEKSVE